MSLPVTIEGQKLFVTLPSATDLNNFQQLLQTEYRRRMFAAMPTGLPDDEFKRWIRVINEEAAEINPFKNLRALANSADGAALFYHALLRHENPNVTLDFVAELVSRGVEGKPAAMEGLREIRTAFESLLEAKKNDQQPKPPVPVETQPTPGPATSPPSTESSPSGTG